MSAWRDTQSENWIMSWGEFSENNWLEKTLNLRPKAYELVHTGEKLRFKSPRYDEHHDLGLFDLVDADGAACKVVLGEITPGRYAVGYWREQS